MNPAAVAIVIPGELLAALVGGTIILVNAGVAYGVWWIQRQMKENREEVRENTQITKDVKTLVNSQHGALLNRVADSMEAVAEASGAPADAARAVSARTAAEQHTVDTETEKLAAKIREEAKA